MSWVYVPDLAVSNSESASPCPKRVASLTWRGKAMQPQRLPRAWKTGAFTRLLSGLTLPPSTLDRGVASWIASLAAIRANPIPSPESALAPTTIGSLSTKCFASSRNAGRIVSSGKTCRGTLTDSLRLLSRHWKDWATALRQEYSARPKREHPIGASDCSSWPTARASDGAKGGPNQRGSSGDVMLPSAAAQWPTPMAGTPAQNGNNAAGNSDFSRKAMAIATAGNWTTPSCSDGHRGGKLTDAMSGTSLVQQVNTVWETPGVALTEGSRMTRGGARADELLLTGQAVALSQSHSAHPDPATSDGPTSSQPRRTLNPLFVEWLMGWPENWTSLTASIGSVPVEMECSRSPQLSHGFTSNESLQNDFESNCPEACATRFQNDKMRMVREHEEFATAPPGSQQTLRNPSALPILSH